MEAIIKSVELKKIVNRYYFKITITDIVGNTYVIDNPLWSDPISFRRQVFGIMTACGTYDLMKLATNTPIPKKIIGYYANGMKILENEANEWFSFKSNKAEYECEETDEIQRKAMQIIIENNNNKIDKSIGSIEKISSASGVFLLFFRGEHLSTSYVCGQQIYWGFGEPITIGDPKKIKIARNFAKIYQTFIVSLMKFYGINDLLHFGGTIDKLPIVDITLNNNKVDLITNPSTGLGFSVSKKYNYIDSFNLEKGKNKNLKQ